MAAMPQVHITNDHIFQLGGHSNNNSPTSPLDRFRRSLSNRGPTLAATVRPSIARGHPVPPADDASQLQQWAQYQEPANPYGAPSYANSGQSMPQHVRHFNPHELDAIQTSSLPYVAPVCWTPSSASPHSASTQASSAAWTLPSASSGSHMSAFTDLSTGFRNEPVELPAFLGLDCPLRCNGSSSCTWKSGDGLADMNRVREHVGKRHGLLCQNCQLVFKTQTDFQKHNKRKESNGECPKGDGEHKNGFPNLVDRPATTIIDFYTTPKKLKNSADDEWYAGYKILNPDWKKAGPLPSPYYRDNLARHKPTELEANSAISLCSANVSGSSGNNSPVDETGVPDGMDSSAGPSANAFSHEDSHLHVSEQALNNTMAWPVFDIPPETDWTTQILGGGVAHYPPELAIPDMGYGMYDTNASASFENALSGDMMQASPAAKQSEEAMVSNRSILRGFPRKAIKALSRHCSQPKALFTGSGFTSAAAGAEPTSRDASSEPTVPELQLRSKRNASTSSNSPAAKRQAREFVDEETRKLRSRVEVLTSRLGRSGDKNRQLEDEKRQLIDAVRQMKEKIELWELCDDEIADLQPRLNMLNESIQRIQHLL